MTSGHIYTSLICGPGSPLFELLKRSGKYLGLGVDIRIIGLYHVLEDNWDGFPVKVHYPEPFVVRYVDANGQPLERELIVLDPDVARTRIDQYEGKWIRRWLTDHMRSRGILREFKIGQASCWVVDARSFYDELKSLTLKGITIYTTKEQFESRQP
jgi:aminoglycoside N3'-acetyltransferase